jgi:hypothetical protein
VTAQGHFIKLAGYPGHDQGRDGLDREPCGGEHDKKQDCGAHAGSTVLVRRHPVRCASAFGAVRDPGSRCRAIPGRRADPGPFTLRDSPAVLDRRAVDSFCIWQTVLRLPACPQYTNG